MKTKFFLLSAFAALAMALAATPANAQGAYYSTRGYHHQHHHHYHHYRGGVYHRSGYYRTSPTIIVNP